MRCEAARRTSVRGGVRAPESGGVWARATACGGVRPGRNVCHADQSEHGGRACIMRTDGGATERRACEHADDVGGQASCGQITVPRRGVRVRGRAVGGEQAGG